MRVIGQDNIASLFGVTPKTIIEWQAQGFPCLVRGTSKNAPSEYDGRACVQWVVDRAVARVQTETPKDRLARLQGDAIERDMAIADGLLVRAEDVEPLWRAACEAAREHLLQAKRRLSAAIGKAKTSQARDAAIEEVHEEFLRRLADWRRGGDVEPDA